VEAIRNSTTRSFIQAQEDSPSLKQSIENVGQPKLKPAGVSYSKHKSGIYFREIYNKHMTHVGDTLKVKQLLVPEQFRKAILQIAHDGPMAAHIGTSKVRQSITTLFWWPSIYHEVDTYIKSCPRCQDIGKGKQKNRAALVKTPVIARTFSRIAMDVVGPIETSKRGNRFILTLIDMHSRYPFAIPMKNVEAKNVAKEMFLIFTNIGICEEILTDLGTNFTMQGY
jgi:hypothetical protein